MATGQTHPRSIRRDVNGQALMKEGEPPCVEAGELPINLSGGVVSTNPIGATGLIRCAEVVLQIQGKAGERQVPDVNLGIGTGFGGCGWTDMLAYGKKKPE